MGGTWSELREAAGELARTTPHLAGALQETVLDAAPSEGLARLLHRISQPVWLDGADLVGAIRTAFASDDAVVEALLEDLSTIAARNLEAGGAASIWLGSRGFHILVAHRTTHALWTSGDRATALAVKAGVAALGADIHPAARFGRRLFLDHGIGVVVGETAVVGDDVSLWHGVTLGSTLMQKGDRHPKVGNGVVLGAGATILGNIEVGEGVIVAAGSVVLRPVPPFTLVAGNPAEGKPGYRHPFAYGSPTGGVAFR